MTRSHQYLNQAQCEERLGLAPKSLSGYKLPPPDAIIGPIPPGWKHPDKLPRGTVRGWLPSTIDRWNASRPGRGARTDLKHD